MTVDNDQDALAALSDEDLFEATLSGPDLDAEPPAPEPEPEPAPALAPEPVAPPVPEPVVAPAPEAPKAPEPQPAPKQDHVVPLHVLLEERREFQRRLDELRGQAKPKEPEAPKPELWENPDDYVDQRVQQTVAPVAQSQAQIVEHFSKMLAVRDHGQEAVQSAYVAMDSAVKSGDPEAYAAYRRVMSSMDPYGELISWNKRQSVLREVGNDPAAYRAKVQDDALSDPAFLAKAAERLRAQAAANPIVSLPAGSPGSAAPTAVTLPSVSRAGSPAPARAETELVPDMELFQQLTASPRRR